MRRQTILITGATGGIGKATAIGLARENIDLILVGRNDKKGQAVVAEIQAKGYETVRFIKADLSLVGDIVKLVTQLQDTLSQLDGLVLSAGVATMTHTITEEGLEASLVVNYLHRFMLSNLLYELLRQSDQARIAVIASAGAQSRFMKLDYEHLNGADNWNGMKALNQAQVANDLFVYEVAQRWHQDNIAIHAVNPGFVNTDIRRNGFNNRWVLRLLSLTESMFAIAPENSAEIPVNLILKPEYRATSGQFYKANMKVTPPSPYVKDSHERQRLWHWSEQKVQSFQSLSFV